MAGALAVEAQRAGRVGVVVRVLSLQLTVCVALQSHTSPECETSADAQPYEPMTTANITPGSRWIPPAVICTRCFVLSCHERSRMPTAPLFRMYLWANVARRRSWCMLAVAELPIVI